MEPTISSTLDKGLSALFSDKLTKEFGRNVLFKKISGSNDCSPVQRVGAKKYGGQICSLLARQLQLAGVGEGGREVLEGPLQASEEEVEEGHEEDEDEGIAGPQAGGGGLLPPLLLLPFLNPRHFRSLPDP